MENARAVRMWRFRGGLRDCALAFEARFSSSRTMSRVHPLTCLLSVLWCVAAANLHADPATTAVDGAPAEAAPKGLMESDSPLPDPGGLRAKLSDHGVTLGVLYTGEVFGNPTGGYRQGVVEDGLLTTSLDLDFEKLLGLKGFKFHVLAYDPHGASGTR